LKFISKGLDEAKERGEDERGVEERGGEAA
jgi:hypothetical protein